MQLKHETSNSTLGSVNGKKCGRSRTRAVLAEDRAREREQRALEVGERDVLVDRQPLDLVELRRVGGVVVAPVGAAGDDDVERRRVHLHRARLHRRRVHAQQHVVGDVEGVGRLRAGASRRVERVEVVVDELGLGALHDAEAEAEEDVLDLAPGDGEEVDAAGLDGGRAGERDVDHVGRELRVELGRRELGGARLDRGLERLARLVGGAADGAALLGRELGDAAQQVRQLRLATRNRTRTSSSPAVPGASAIAASPAARSSLILSFIGRPSYGCTRTGRRLPPSPR